MKESIEILLEKAAFCLTDKEYNTVKYYATNSMWINLRTYLSDLYEVFEAKEAIQGGLAKEWVALDEMVDISIDLAIQNEERLNEERGIIVKTRFKRKEFSK